MRLLLVLGSFPLLGIGLALLVPFVGVAVHVLFYIEHLRAAYGPWAEYLFGLSIIALVVFSINYRQVLMYGLIPVVAYCCWMTS
jgi:hypothetical protein